MYEQFYKFLANIITKFFEKAGLKPGEKYDIRLSNKEEVLGLYKALSKYDRAYPFVYQAEGEAPYHTYALNIGEINLILASTADDVTDAFLTALRNKVGTDEALFNKTAILFIHDSSLDSILNGSESLQKTGMPLHSASIQKVIETKLKEGDYSSTVRRVIQYVLEAKKGKSVDARNALVEYREVLEVLNMGHIDSRQYNEFGLFYDSGLESVPDKEVKERLSENAKFFGMTFNYHYFNVKDALLEKSLDASGYASINSAYWQTADFTMLCKSMERKKSKQPIEYLPNEKKLTEEGLTYWEAYDKDTAKGRRTLNILIFNPQHLNEIKLNLKFNQTVKESNFQLTKNSDMQVAKDGRYMCLTLKGYTDQISYGRVRYKDTKDYDFRVLVVPVAESVLEDIKSYYKLPIKTSEKGIYIEKDEAIFRLNPQGTTGVSVEVTTTDEVIRWEPDTALTIVSKVEDEETGIIKIVVSNDNVTIPFYLKGEVVKPKVITSMKLAKLKREKELDFTYVYDIEDDRLKLYQDTQQYYAVEEFLECLKYEMQIIEQGYLCYKLEDQLKGYELEVNSEIKQAYETLITYYRNNQTLPSLATLTEELRELMEKYIQAYISIVESIAQGAILTKEERNLNKLGCLEKRGEILWTPLHPLNIAYELQKAKILGQDEIDEQILRKIKPLGFAPYIKNEEGMLYESKEMTTLGWLKFLETDHAELQGKFEIAKIVERSIQAFTMHFQYLFNGSIQRPLKLNLIHLGEAKDVLGGLLRYVSNHLKKEEPITPIEVHFYTNQQGKSIFSEINSGILKLGPILENYEISNNKEDTPRLLKVFREKVKTFEHRGEGEPYLPSHITFIGMKHKQQLTYRNSSEVLAGSSLGGIINAPSLYVENNVHVKTVGLSGLENCLFTKIVKAINAINAIGMSNNPFDENATLATVVEEDEIVKEPIGHSSNWIVYLEPKMAYSYFNKQENSLIHYVDRLYAPNMIDAITLSNKVETYKLAITSKLEEMGLSIEVEDLNHFIKLSSIINGEWLIELLSSKKTTTVESIHNPLIIRWCTEILNREDFMWIPVSLHEFMRTCESIGIRGSKGILKNKNYERFINDLIWVGVRTVEENVALCFYPISIRKTDKEPGIYKELSENLNDTSFEGIYFRQLIIERALFNLKELVRGGLFEAKDVHQLFSCETRSKLLQGNFNVININAELLGKEANIIFKETEEVQLMKGKTALTIYMNKKALWKKELQLSEVVTQEQEEIVPTTSSDVIEQGKEVLDLSKPLEVTEAKDSDEGLEDLLIVPRYSILYFYETLPNNISNIIDFYLEKGIKLYLVLNNTQTEFEDMVGSERFDYYKGLIKKQIMSITYEVGITLEDDDTLFILDGQVECESFYETLASRGFNTEQYEIEHEAPNHHMSVKAGAGTGKTKVMIDRIMYLKHMNPALLLSEIAMITFTNESMMEMRTRLSNRLSVYYEVTQNRMYLKWMDELSNMKINTIHSFAVEILKTIGSEIGIVNLKITSYNYLKDRLIEEAIDAYQKEYPTDYETIRYIPQYHIKKIIKELINYLDNRAIDVDVDKKNVDFGDSMMGYHKLFEFVVSYVSLALQNEKLESGKYEINDLIKMLKNMTQVEQISQKLKLKYLMVDEFQDTDEVQVSFIAWLIEKLHATLFVVGDIKQSIYRFRGADYTAFSQLEKNMTEPLHERYITKNYRSVERVLNPLNKLFAAISEEVDNLGFDERSILQATKFDESAKGFKLVPMKDDESRYVAIKDLYHEHLKQGTVCLLVRTNTQVNEAVRILEEMGVPTIAEVNGNFYRQPAVRDFYLLVRGLIYTERYEEMVLLEQSVYGSSKISMREILSQYEEDTSHARLILQGSQWYKDFVKLADNAKKALPLKVIRQIIDEQQPQLKFARKYYHSLKEEKIDKQELLKIAQFKGMEYEANLNHLLYLIQKEFTDQTITLGALETFLKTKITSDVTEDRIHLKVEDSLQAMRIMTVHKAKGLEFETVIIPFTNKNKFSNYYRNQFILGKVGDNYQLGYKIYPKTDKKNREETCNNYFSQLMRDEQKEIIGEETRLLYVACTRAKHQLYALVEDVPSRNSRINSWQDLLMRGDTYA